MVRHPSYACFVPQRPENRRSDSPALEETYIQLATPPCPEHAPERFAACEYVPSLHRAMAPAFTLFDASSLPTADFGDAFATAVGDAIGVAGDGLTVGLAVTEVLGAADVFVLFALA